MNVQTFMNHYAPHLMTDFSEEMETLLTDKVFRSHIGKYELRITPHPFVGGDMAILIDQKGGTLLYSLVEWEKDPHKRLQIITGVKPDPNNSWIDPVETFLIHERLYRKYPSKIDHIQTNLKTGYVAVYCTEWAEPKREDVLNQLFQKGYDCTFNRHRKHFSLIWHTYRELSELEACCFIDTYEHLTKGVVYDEETT